MDRVPLFGPGRARHPPFEQMFVDGLRGRGTLRMTIGSKGTPNLLERAFWWGLRRRLRRRYGIVATGEGGQWYLHEPRSD